MADTGQRHFLTVDELAVFLRVSRMTAYQLVWSGEVPSVKVGRQIRIPRRELERQFAEPTTEPGA